MFRKHKSHLLALLALLSLTLALSVPALAQSASAHLIVNTSFLNVRSGPSVSHDIITTVSGGTVLPIHSRARNLTWYKVQSDAGEGYVNSNYTIKRGDFSDVPWDGAPSNQTTPARAVTPGEPHVVVNTTYLNVRTGPGPNYPVLAVVQGGMALPVVQISNGGHWYEVETAAGNGWLRHMYTATRGNYDNVPQAGVAAHVHSVTGSAIIGGAPHVVVNTAYLNVRSGPGVGSSILYTIPGGSSLLVTGGSGNGNWYEVEGHDGPVWVNTSYTATRGDWSRIPGATSHLNGSTPRAIVNTARLNIRSGPGAGNSRVVVVNGGTVLEVIGRSADGVWHQVKGGFGMGWLHGGYAVTRGDVGSLGVTG